MVAEKLIPSEVVAHEMNLWYQAILRFERDASVKRQQKIKNMLVKMEKNQDLLLYYSLLDFRAKLNTEKPVPIRLAHEEICQLAGEHGRLNDTLNYYYYLFNGLYEYKQKNFIKSLNCYRIALENVKKLHDDAELAQCHYRMAQVYFQINYPVMSWIYAQLAEDFYNQSPEYAVSAIYCENVKASNLVRTHSFRKALNIFLDIHQRAKLSENKRLVAVTYFNIGIAQMYLNQCLDAEYNFFKSMQLFGELSDRFESHAACNFYESVLKQGKLKRSELIFNDCLTKIKKWNDQETALKIELIKEIFSSKINFMEIDHKLFKLKKLQLYKDMDEFSIQIAEKCNKMGYLQQSIKYYKISNHIKNQMMGEKLNEKSIKNTQFLNNYTSVTFSYKF
ncbi:MAG: hypothetical protein ABF868_03880 [Sporolactobacillus sp.]